MSIDLLDYTYPQPVGCRKSNQIIRADLLEHDGQQLTVGVPPATGGGEAFAQGIRPSDRSFHGHRSADSQISADFGALVIQVGISRVGDRASVGRLNTDVVGGGPQPDGAAVGTC